MIWFYLRRWTGFMMIYWGWKIYPGCQDKRMLTRALAAWTEMIMLERKKR